MSSSADPPPRSGRADHEGKTPLAIVTGAGGLIGSHLVTAASRWTRGWEVRGLSRPDLDLTDAARVREMWSALRPDLVLHCAALSQTGACEIEPARAWILNVDVTARLAELAAHIPFVLFSSDQVFDGRKGWYVETDAVAPLNVYGETKVAAERIVLDNPKHTVIRTTLTAGHSPKGDQSFTEALRRAWEAKRTVTLFTDEFRCPIPATATARAVWELVTLDRPGLYHLAGSDRLSRWEIGQLLAAGWPELEAKMVAGSVRDHPGTSRPADASMRSRKLEALLPFRMPGFRDWLATHPDAADPPEG